MTTRSDLITPSSVQRGATHSRHVCTEKSSTAIPQAEADAKKAVYVTTEQIVLIGDPTGTGPAAPRHASG
jgi:hypothetical protein